jgi:YidC/Oxa1 family membrane protein insertase
VETRILIAIILSLGLVVAYQELVLKRLYPPPQRQATPHRTAEPVASAIGKGAGIVTPAGVSTPAAGQLAARAGREIRIDTDLYEAVFTSRGARLKSFRLKKFREAAAFDSPPYEMVKPAAGGSLPLGVLIKQQDGSLDDQALTYATDAPARVALRPGEKFVLAFSARTKDGWTIRKTFALAATSYVFDMSVAVDGAGPAAEALALAMAQPLAAHAGYYDIPEVQADVGGKAIVENEKALTKGVAPLSGEIAYAGFGDRYFLSVFMPRSPDKGTLEMTFNGSEAGARVWFPAARQLDARVYIGPKQLEVLDAVNPFLTKAIDFGWSGILALAFLRALKLFHLVAPNWGWDIILMTVALRVAMLPMSIRSQRSMIRLNRLQPQMQRIREKFKDDQERLQKEMVDLYKRNHVNPLGGCAPMLIQFPIFIGLYQALLNAVELRHAPFMGWITDLSAPDCLMVRGMPKLPLTSCGGIPVLVLLMGLSTFLQQWMSPQSPDPSQQRMMMLSPVIFTVMLVNFPAGLSLYYFASNVLGIMQQFFLNREFKQLGPATA